jgi:gamma-glutamyltranspeptidase / glutathione hydrolase
MEPFDSRRPAVHARSGMVASSQPLAAQIGLQVLKDGGNAVDAAIAVAAMVNVTEPMMNGLGGDAFILVRWQGKLHGLNASGRCPQGMTRETFVTAGWTRMPQAGWGSVCVPGAPDGYFTLHDRFGSMKFADLVEPAAAYAEEGFPVGQKIAHAWEWGASKLRLSDQSTAQYLLQGRPPQAGEIFRQPNLAQTWRALGKHGRDYFYAGDLARKIVAASDAGGGYLKMPDFAAQRSEWADPISANYRGLRVVEMPPNGQGLIVLMALRILEGYDLASLFRRDLATAEHLILEALKLSFADAERYIADPNFAAVDVEELLSDAFIASRRSLIRMDRANPTPTAGVLGGNTTYFTVVDKDRNAVSFITSISDVFGSGMVAGDTGIILHNRAAEFSLEPGHPNEIAPGKRPRHSILPAMVFRGDDLHMTFGCMGANMQPQGQVQILVNLIDRAMNPQQAIDASRVRVLGANRISVESTFSPDVIARLASFGHEIIPGEAPPADWLQPHDFLHSFMGSAQAIVIDRAFGTLCGGSDPRLDGIAIGY